MKNKLINRGTDAERENALHQGKKFEEKFDIITYLKKEISGIKIIEEGNRYWKMLLNNVFLGYVFKQTGIHHLLKDKFNMNVREIWSKKMNPDGGIILNYNESLLIFELKNQNRTGSVDEKIQTGSFKKDQYIKLADRLNISNTRFIYILAKWFESKAYDDVFDWLKKNGVEYYIDEYPKLREEIISIVKRNKDEHEKNNKSTIIRK